MLPFPPVIGFTLAAVGAAALAKVLAREWRRVNAELRRAGSRASQPAPTLQRDPTRGVPAGVAAGSVPIGARSEDGRAAA